MADFDFGAHVRENYFNALNHKKTLWQPMESENYVYGGMDLTVFEKGPIEGGLDGFGVQWARPLSAGGGAVPAPNSAIIENAEDLCSVTFPDLDAYDWEGEGALWLDGVDRSSSIIEYGSGNGMFERLVSLMGFEGALITMVTDPELVDAFFDKLTDFKIEVIKRAKRYYQPDIFTLYDDCATNRSPFMSPQTFHDLIMPHDKRIFDECKREGLRPSLHCCGYATPLVESFIESGAQCWTSVQPCNDIAELCKKYGDRICIAGGMDSFSLPGFDRDDEIIYRGVDKCLEDFGGLPGYIFGGGLLGGVEEGDDIMKAWEPTMKMVAYAEQRVHETLDLSVVEEER